MALKYPLIKRLEFFFSRRNNLPKIVLKIDQDQIKVENRVKFLGVIFDAKLCWKPHIDSLKL